MTKWYHFLPLAMMMIFAGACGSSRTPSEEPPVEASPTEGQAASASPTSQPGCELQLAAYPSNSPDGNHWLEGRGNFPEAEILRVDLGSEVQWVVGLGTEAGSLWLASDEIGELYIIRVETDQPEASLFNAVWPEAAPFGIRRTESGMEIVGERLQPASPLTYPALLPAGDVVTISRNGRLLYSADGISRELDIAGLPDSRILVDERGRVALYINPTGSYDHGVLGDRIEADGLVVVEPETGELLWATEAEGELVFEGIAPLWVDFNRDGAREVLTTASDPSGGARYLLFTEGGGEAASSEAIGQGYRWRHAIAVGPLGPEGEWELVGVRTPHLKGVVEYFRWEGDHLEMMTELTGYSSHSLGSRNLDQAVAGDFDSDGGAELLVPTEDRSALAAIRRRSSGAVEEWRLELESILASNLAIACHGGEELALAAGLQNGVVQFWIP
ncbi:MAG: hypothetical protein ACLFWD_04175 [Anaerolineales bacterium]